jgi:hypothetical protein
LNKVVNEVFHERQTYRIDHYLGKETAQNIMVLRFANAILEPLWNSRYIDHVQISGAEPLGVEARGPYYETSGALRDMIQNHLLQLLSLVAMEPPVELSADAIRDEKVKVIKSLRPMSAENVARDVVRGQYTAGSIGGKEVVAYRAEDRVNPKSMTETYAALKVHVDTWRWAGVPFYVRFGKRLAKGATEIAVQFKDVPPVLFSRDVPIGPNVLVIRIQTGRRHLTADSGKAARYRLEHRASENGFRLRHQFRQSLARSLRASPARCDGRRCDAFCPSRRSRERVGIHRSHRACLAQVGHAAADLLLSLRLVGPQGSGRSPGARRTLVAPDVRSNAHACHIRHLSSGFPVEVANISKELKKLWETSGGTQTRASLINFAVYFQGLEGSAANTEFIKEFTRQHACQRFARLP